MTIWRLLVCLTAMITCSSPINAAEIARLAYGKGHLAAQSAKQEWQGLRAGDEIPASSHLRTSPAGAVRIELPSALLTLAGETDLDLDVTSKRMTLGHGRALLQNSAENAGWTVSAGTTRVVCAPGSEVEIWFDEAMGINVLQGKAQVTRISVPPLDLTAPLEWVVPLQGDATATIPTAEDWVDRIRSRTELRLERGIGQLLAKDAQSDSPVRLEVARYHVNVVIQPPVALVQIDESFFNPYFQQQEGTFVFNLPDGASVSRFAMFVTHDQLIEGELIDRKRADQVYTSIVRSKRDPAILEQIGTNLFRMRVFPIFGRDTKRILLDYTIPLVSERGKFRFELPLMSDLKPIWDFGIKGTIHPPFATGSIKSPTFRDLEFINETDGRVTFSKKAKDVQPPANFLIDYRAEENRQPTARTFSTDNEHQHFVVTLPESAEAIPNADKTPADVLVLVDTSGRSGNLAKSRLAARTVVENLGPNDRWQLGCVDVSFRALTSEWVVSRTSAARAALRELNESYSLGEGRLDVSLKESLRIFAKSPEGRRRVIIYVGHGETVAGMTNSWWQHDILNSKNPNRQKFHAVKIGPDNISGSWVKSGVLQLDGRLFDFQSSEGLQELFEWTLAGMPPATLIESCSIDGVSSDDLFFSPTWVPGRELHISGTCLPKEMLELKLKLAGQPLKTQQIRVNGQPRAHDVFTGRFWARQKLDALLATDTTADHEPIVRLCQEWSLMSPHTAFLVLESEKDYERWNISRHIRHRYWTPVGAIEPLPLEEHLRQHDRETAEKLAVKPQQRSIPESPPVQAIFKAAKEALAMGNARVAEYYLSQRRGSISARDSVEFDALMAEARIGLRREATLSDLQLWRSLVDRRAPSPVAPIAPLLLSFSYGGVNPEYLERHPNAMDLLKTAPDFKTDEVSVKELAAAIQQVSGVPVIIDETNLKEAGVSSDETTSVKNLRGVPLRDLASRTLAPLGLTLVPEGHCLRIVTQESADERMITHVYPVVDLLNSNVLPKPERIANPNLAKLREQQRHREVQLKHLIDVQFKEVKLSDAIDAIAKKAGFDYWIDTATLSEAGVKLDQTVSLSVNQWPADLVLNELLHQTALVQMIDHGVVTITTIEKTEEKMETRLYSAAGIIDESTTLPSKRNGPGFGGGMSMGGMGGGMGMGGGFGGGLNGGGMGLNDIGLPLGNRAGKAELEDSGPLIDNDFESNPEIPEERNVSFASPASGQSDFAQSAMMAHRIAMQATPGKWQDQDGEGGTMVFHEPSFTIIARQTPHVHAEMKEMFAKLRRLPRHTRVGTSILSRRYRPERNTGQQYMLLQRTIMQITPGRWQDQDGGGGTIQPHLLTDSLVIRQTERTHEEVEQLFAQLRRARYIADILPWTTSLEGIDDMLTVFDRPTITDLPKNDLGPIPIPASREEALRQLSVRVPSLSLDQQWQHASTDKQRHTVDVRHKDGRLELGLFDRAMRAEGPLAAVAYPGLTLVEIDAWGDAVRQVADALLPWMPHRSNEELAQLFDVMTESENDTQSTLRLMLPRHADTYLKATYSKQTGELLTWQGFVTGTLQYELKFSPKVVIATDSNEQELERWELLRDEIQQPLPAVDAGWTDFVVVEPSQGHTPLVRAREALRQGNPELAKKLLHKLVSDRPHQPLLNFLLAWSIEYSHKIDGTQQKAEREALSRVIANGPAYLLTMISPSNFPSLGDDFIHDMFLAIPDEKRTAETWAFLAEIDFNQNRIDQALKETDRAIALTSDGGRRDELQIRRIGLLLKIGRPSEAERAALALTAVGVAPMQLLELGDMFALADQINASVIFFDQYRRSVKLSRFELGELAFRQAMLIRNSQVRWDQWLAADPDRTEDKNRMVDMVVSEATSVEDAEILAGLASKMAPGKVKTKLLIRQAELTRDAAKSADIAWNLYQSKRLPAQRLNWLVQTMFSGRRYQEVIDVLERWLRKTGNIDTNNLAELQRAYRELGRETEALRVSSEITYRQKNVK